MGNDGRSSRAAHSVPSSCKSHECKEAKQGRPPHSPRTRRERERESSVCRRFMASELAERGRAVQGRRARGNHDPSSSIRWKTPSRWYARVLLASWPFGRPFGSGVMPACSFPPSNCARAQLVAVGVLYLAYAWLFNGLSGPPSTPSPFFLDEKLKEEALSFTHAPTRQI